MFPLISGKGIEGRCSSSRPRPPKVQPTAQPARPPSLLSARDPSLRASSFEPKTTARRGPGRPRRGSGAQRRIAARRITTQTRELLRVENDGRAVGSDTARRWAPSGRAAGRRQRAAVVGVAAARHTPLPFKGRRGPASGSAPPPHRVVEDERRLQTRIGSALSDRPLSGPARNAPGVAGARALDVGEQEPGPSESLDSSESRARRASRTSGQYPQTPDAEPPARNPVRFREGWPPSRESYLLA